MFHNLESRHDRAEREWPPTCSHLQFFRCTQLLDEVENLLPGSRSSLTVNVGPGTYLVMCNLPGHYEAGMWAYLTVTES
jgi:hypothetical protein